MSDFSWNEVNLLRGLIYKELDQQPGDLTKAELISALEKLDEIRLELQKEEHCY